MEKGNKNMKILYSVPEWMLVVLLLILSIMAIIIFSRKGVLRFQLRRGCQ